MKDVEYNYIEGGICAPQGFLTAGLHLGFRKNPERKDACLVVSEEQNTSAAAVFTQNVFCAAPVQVSREVAKTGHARAIILNSGNANAATGSVGLDAAHFATQTTAEALNLKEEEVFVASTGVIGVPLSTKPYVDGLPALANTLGSSAEHAHAAACAIMTTDTHPKECAVNFSANGQVYTIGGMCKGSGMIAPNMATMLAVLTTDAPVEQHALSRALKMAVNESFNKVTVDSDTSTNDSVFLLANGRADGKPIELDESVNGEHPSGNAGLNAGEHPIEGGDPAKGETSAFVAFAQALQAVCENLARQIAADGEGATKLVTVNVCGAANEKDADLAARAVANSPLVKTAIAGHDCNWGRVAGALGKSGAKFSQEKCDISFMGMEVCKNGLAQGFDEDEALKRFEEPEIVIDINLHAGEAKTRIWTCDLTHEYIHINADYRS